MIRIENLNVHYTSHGGLVHAVRDVSIEVAKGEFYTLLGPSGCGKTTTLRCIAGLETPSSGRISLNDKVIFDGASRKLVPAHQRDIGMVFQSYAIWPHLTVAENVAFPLQETRRDLSRSARDEKVRAALARVQLSQYIDRPAPHLSGGQQQRLALARAIVREPAVLLLDEPLSNLDAKLRDETRAEIRELVKRLEMTTIYVTHDQVEALSMADRVAVMESGVIAQEAQPRDIYQRPRNRFVASFIGRINFVEGRTTAAGRIDTALGALDADLPDGLAAGAGQQVTLAVRPENITVLRPGEMADTVIEGHVTELMFLGETLECRVKSGGTDLGLRLHPATTTAVGDPIRLGVARRDLLVLKD
jgi:iron(III) transport system ATP-binding protein